MKISLCLSGIFVFVLLYIFFDLNLLTSIINRDTNYDLKKYLLNNIKGQSYAIEVLSNTLTYSDIMSYPLIFYVYGASGTGKTTTIELVSSYQLKNNAKAMKIPCMKSIDDKHLLITAMKKHRKKHKGLIFYIFDEVDLCFNSIPYIIENFIQNYNDEWKPSVIFFITDYLTEKDLAISKQEIEKVKLFLNDKIQIPKDYTNKLIYVPFVIPSKKILKDIYYYKVQLFKNTIKNTNVKFNLDEAVFDYIYNLSLQINPIQTGGFLYNLLEDQVFSEITRFINRSEYYCIHIKISPKNNLTTLIYRGYFFYLKCQFK